MPTEQDFFEFVYKRQLIWYKRFVLKQAPPWTEDHVLATYKIINMYRELDKCTIYLMEKLNGIQDRKTVLLNIIFYRFFNLCNIYEDLKIEPFSEINNDVYTHVVQKLGNLKKDRPIFNNAYLISSGGKGVKHEHVLENLRQLDIPTLLAQIDQSKTPPESFSYLVALPMVGPFLACEFWTDLAYLKWFKQGWNDDDFVNIGPGAKWGLEILYEDVEKKSLMIKLEHLHQIQEKILSTVHLRLGEKYSWGEIAYKGACSHYPFLSITNVEGCLCEFRKYWNISHGKGRRKYFTPGIFLEGKKF